MTYDPEALMTEAKRLFAESRRVSAEISAQGLALRERAQPPSVIPVVSYNYWHRPIENEVMELGDTTLSATYRLEAMIDHDLGHPHGVYVGGAFISWDELQDQYENELYG